MRGVGQRSAYRKYTPGKAILVQETAINSRTHSYETRSGSIGAMLHESILCEDYSLALHMIGSMETNDEESGRARNVLPCMMKFTHSYGDGTTPQIRMHRQTTTATGFTHIARSTLTPQHKAHTTFRTAPPCGPVERDNPEQSNFPYSGTVRFYRAILVCSQLISGRWD